MRLLAAGLTALWAATSLLVLVGYRPGGPADLLVGVALLVPVGISAVALRWPPAPRGQMTYRIIASLAVGTGLILLPSLAGVWRQITDRGLQTLLPSPEAGYPWALAILGTSLFAALGPTRLLLAPGARRRTRLAASLGAGLAVALVTSTLVASVAVGNNRALAGRPAQASRFGPTDPKELPPRCDAAIAVGSTAQLEMVLSGTIDGRSIGGALVRGARAGADFSWTSEVASVEALGLGGAALVGTQGWLREPGGSWQRVPGTQVEGESLDVAVLGDGLDTTARAAAEDLGFDYLEGARFAPLPPRDRRRHVPTSLPAGPLAGGRRRPAPLAWRARLLDLRRCRAGSGRRVDRRRGVHTAAWRHPGSARGQPDGNLARQRDHDRPAGALTGVTGSMDRWDPGADAVGRKRDRLARFYRVTTYLEAHPEGATPGPDRGLRRDVAPERLPGPAGAGGRAGHPAVGRGRSLGDLRQGVPAGLPADPLRGDGGLPGGSPDGALRGRARSRPRGRVPEAGRGTAAGAGPPRRSEPWT